MIDLFDQDEINKIALKSTNALENFAKVFNDYKIQKSKHLLLYPMKEAGFTIEEAKKFNFKISFHLWSLCSKEIVWNKRGPRFLETNISDKINSFMKENSTVAANRYLILQTKNARYSNNSINSLYNSFPYKNELALSTFRKKIPLIYKKPHR